ncbi:alpha/beta hydrolase, partial [Myxococcota bacterium]|nr:alpha/beta hydrolase [Myxococcota bacterium]
FVVELSLGGLLSLNLAAEADVAGVVSIGAPLALSWPIPQAVPIVKYLMPMLPKRSGSDIRDPAARARHPGLPVMPLKSVHELVRLQRSLSSRLGQITAPALIAHGVHDLTARPADAQKIFDSVGSADKELLWLENSAHVVPVDYDGLDLAERVAAFLAARL